MGLTQVLLQGLPTPPSGQPSLSWVWWVIAVLFLVVCALIILLSRKREDVQALESKRAVAAEGLVKTRDLEIAELKRQVELLTQKNADLESENTVIGGIKLSELAKFWAEKEKFEDEFEVLKVKLNRANKTLERIAEGGSDDIHKTQS